MRVFVDVFRLTLCSKTIIIVYISTLLLLFTNAGSMSVIACFWMQHIAIATEICRAPSLLGEAFALTSEDGIVACASDEAARHGVEPGHKSSGAKTLCPSLRLLPYTRPIYEQAASMIWNGIAVESSVVEPLSPEICYAELDDRHVAPRLRSFVGELSTLAKIPRIQVRGLATC